MLGELNPKEDQWIRIKEIFASAIDLRAHERSTFLTEVCGQDTELREQIERLLIYHERTGGPLDRCLVQNTEEDIEPRRLQPGNIVCARFHIIRLIGNGGMGEVFEAEDSVLGERIAIKTIRPEIANQSGLVERLRREVQLSRQVSHPNVCRVFDLWEHEEPAGTRTSFLTMELLEGETVAQYIESNGPFSANAALPLIRQIAAGLGEVHRLGIVHRDLKPSNLYLGKKPDGSTRVVVTDFGLARPINAGEQSRTQTGFVFGTPAYMAPEQFESGEATYASDIYSFGVTIFEMITGRKHPLMQPSEILSSIGPNWDRALEKCWSLDPNARPRDPWEVVALLEAPAFNPRLRRVLKSAAWGTAGILALAAAAYTIGLPSPEPQYRLSKITSDDGLSWEPSISADGQTIAYSSDSAGHGDLDIWVRRLNSANAFRITNDPANDWGPAISRDGRQVAYNSDRPAKGIYIRSISGGPERLLSNFGHEPAFSPDGKQVAFWVGEDTSAGGRLYITDASGGTPRQLATMFRDARHPAWSQTGEEILFEGCGPGCTNPDTQSDWWIIAKDGSHARSTGALQAVLKQGLTLYFSSPWWRNGKVYFAARLKNDTNIWRMDLKPPLIRGRWRALPITSSTQEEIEPAVSADGSIAFAGLDGQINLWLAALDGSGARRLGSNMEIDSMPSMSRDGKLILYFRRLGNDRWMIVRELAGNNILNVEVPAKTRGMMASSGQSIVYTSPRGAERDLYERRAPTWKEVPLGPAPGEVVDVIGDSAGVLVATRAGIEFIELSSGRSATILQNAKTTFDEAAVSPNGKQIAYLGVVNAEHSQVFVAPYENGSVLSQEAVPITTAEHWNDKPRWTEDGRAVIYISDRDGFVCIWKQEAHGRTVGEPRSVLHFHQARISPMRLSRAAFNLSVSNNDVLYNANELRSNVWLARPDF